MKMNKNKRILQGEEARNALAIGVNKIVEVVGSTLGPKGRNVILDQSYGAPKITKDGVSVAKKVASNNPAVNLGIRFVRNAAETMNSKVGDGTTTTTVLAGALFKGCHKNIAAGASPIELKRGIDKAGKVVVASLKKQSKQIKGNDQVVQIATISANGDKEIGQMIATGFEKVGPEGVITIEEAKSTASSLKFRPGMQFERSYLSHFFITNPERMTTELESPLIFITKEKVSKLKDILPLLEAVSKKNRSLLIIAEDVEGEALTALALNKMRGALKVAAVKAPGFGDHKNNMLESIAVLTGAVLISQEGGRTLESVTIEDLGEAEKVNITKEETTIVNGKGDKKAVEARIKQIRAMMENSSDYEREKLQTLLAKLSGGVAILSVGAPTEPEMKEKKDRVQDAVSATKAALKTGILPGGGVSFVRSINDVESFIKKGSSLDNEDQVAGAKIVLHALEAPIRKIAENAGVDGSIVLQKVKEGKEDYGYNATKETYENLYKSGVIDPANVEIDAFEIGSSIATSLAMTDSILLEKEEKGKTGGMNRNMPPMM